MMNKIKVSFVHDFTFEYISRHQDYDCDKAAFNTR